MRGDAAFDSSTSVGGTGQVVPARERARLRFLFLDNLGLAGFLILHHSPGLSRNGEHLDDFYTAVELILGGIKPSVEFHVSGGHALLDTVATSPQSNIILLIYNIIYKLLIWVVMCLSAVLAGVKSGLLKS